MNRAEALRLADSLQDLLVLGGVHTDTVGQQSVEMLRRWPDGEPVGKVMTEAEMGIGWDRRAGNVLWWRKPDAPALLYTAPPAKPDGEPVAWLYKRNYDGRKAAVTTRMPPDMRGADEWTETPLYTATPADSERIAALEEERDQYKMAAEAEANLADQYKAKCAALEADRDSWQEQASQRVADCERFIERIAALEAENARLRDAVADKVSAATMLTGMTTGPDGLRIGLEGGAASLLAEMLAQQFKDSGGINYVELSFVSRKAVPGEAFVVTVQRVDGKTPHALRAEAEAKHAALEAALEQARVALESYVEPQYVGGVDNDAALLAKARAALRAIEEVRK